MIEPTGSDWSAAADLRHLSILNEVDGGRHVSQRNLAERLEIGVSLVNRLVRELTDGGHLEVVNPEVRPFAYRLTGEGEYYRRRLTREKYRSVVGGLRNMEEEIRRRLRAFRDAGLRTVVLYGAGDVFRVALPLVREQGLEPVAVVDDDPEAQGSVQGGFQVRCPSTVPEVDADGILITTLRHAEAIRERLAELKGAELPVLEL